MARLTVDQIMVQIASTVNQESTSPSVGGAEWTLWMSFINRAHQEWAESNDWEELRKDFYPTIIANSTATVVLPQDFKKIAAAPILFGTSQGDGVNGQEYPETMPEQKGLYNQDDLYVEIRGNLSDGFSMVWHPGTLASGSSILIPYFSTPTSLVTSNQVLTLGDPQYVVDRVIGYILEARSDPRFQQQEAKAREKLLQMVEQSNLSKYTSYAGQNYVQTSPLRKLGFRMGRN